jgi:hypothetical protein
MEDRRRRLASMRVVLLYGKLCRCFWHCATKFTKIGSCLYLPFKEHTVLVLFICTLFSLGSLPLVRTKPHSCNMSLFVYPYTTGCACSSYSVAEETLGMRCKESDRETGLM